MSVAPHPSVFSTLFALALAAISKGASVISSPATSQIILDFIGILRELGIKISQENGVLEVLSPGQGCIKEPKKQIDIGNNDEFLPLLAGIFATSDYEIFINGAGKRSFSDLILPLFEAGLRLRYARGFTYPITIKGTSNFLPMQHILKKPDAMLESALLLAGVQTLGRTMLRLNHRINRDIYAILNQTNADFSLKEGCIEISGKNWLEGGKTAVGSDPELELFSAILGGSSMNFDGELRAEDYENFELFLSSLVGASGRSRIYGLDNFFFDDSLERLREVESLFVKFGVTLSFDAHYKSLEISGSLNDGSEMVEVSADSYKLLLSAIVLGFRTGKKVFLANPEILFYRFGDVMKNWLRRYD